MYFLLMFKFYDFKISFNILKSKSFTSGNKSLPLTVKSLPYSSSEDEFYPPSAYGESSTNYCSCSSPSTTITSISRSVAKRSNKQLDTPSTIKLTMSPRDGDAMHIEDIELRFRLLSYL